MTRRPLTARRILGAPGAALRAHRRRLGVLLGALAVLTLAPVAAVASPGEITAKKAEVEQVLAQIEELDHSLGAAVEAYNAATVRLDEIRHAQEVNSNDLLVARRNLQLEQAAIARRLVAMYKAGDDDAPLGVILGSASLGELLDRIDTVQRVRDQDARVVREVRQFKASVERQRRQLARARGRQDALVEERDRRKQEIEDALGERRQLADSIRAEISRLEAEERARQERLRREAEARLAAQQAAAKRAQEALEAAREQARENALEAARDRGESEDEAQRQAEAVAAAVAPNPDEQVGAVASTPDGTVAPASRYSGVVGVAMQYLGVPYVWGGESPSGMDCSGLVVLVFRQFGLSLPHYTGDLWNEGVPVDRDQLQPGDLVFFSGLGHMGIYIGGGQMIHAPHTGDVVKITDINSGYYAYSYDGARRIL
jgi:cell wall-associated NlpC family hydrolase